MRDIGKLIKEEQQKEAKLEAGGSAVPRMMMTVDPADSVSLMAQFSLLLVVESHCLRYNTRKQKQEISFLDPSMDHVYDIAGASAQDVPPKPKESGA
jgi:hypothetical protein